MNEIIFFIHSIVIGITTLAALYLGPAYLTGCIALYVIAANLFVLKQITLFGFYATASDAFMIGSMIALQLLQEYFGKEKARQAVSVSFFLLIFYTIVSFIHLLYIPAAHDTFHEHFYALLYPMPRITFASIGVYTCISYLETYLFAFFKQLFRGNYLLVRSTTCITIAQFADTLLFSFFGLYGIVENIGHIIIVSFIIKIFVILLTRPFMWCTYLLQKQSIPT